MSAASEIVTTREITKVFGRLSDKHLLLDVPGAGTPGMKDCCHGGCDNCEFARVFDEMRSGRPKWIALYEYREHIDGRNHRPSWVDQLFQGDDHIERDLFPERFESVPYTASLGPPKSVPSTEPLSAETVVALRDALFQSNGKPIDVITPQQMAESLHRITEAEHGALWSDFERGFLNSICN